MFAAAVSLVFSFTNGAEWDGPYTLKFKVPKQWQNKPLSFFNEVNMSSSSWPSFDNETRRLYMLWC